MQSLKKIVLTASALMCAATFAVAGELDTQQAKEAYSMGASVGNYISDQIYQQGKLGLSADMALVEKGFQDAIRGKSQLSEEDILKFLNSRAEKLNKLATEANAKIAKENKAKAVTFLADNAKKKGVTTTKSGLQYEVLRKGSGATPRTEDVVTVNYTGKLMDGTVFESTYQTKQSARFVVMSIIPGLEEGLKLMKEGAQFRFTIPANLAYGEFGAGQIPPESPLVFELELIKVEKVGAHEGMGKTVINGMPNPHK